MMLVFLFDDCLMVAAAGDGNDDDDVTTLANVKFLSNVSGRSAASADAPAAKSTLPSSRSLSF